MKFTEAIDKLLSTKKAKAKRSNWRVNEVIFFNDQHLRKSVKDDTQDWEAAYVVELEDAKASDWEIVEG